MDKYESILQQCPDGITIDIVQELYKKYNGNTVDILSELWNLNTPNILKNQNYDENHKQKEKWNNIREICSSYEEEMNKVMEKSKQTTALEPTNDIIE